MYWTQNDIYWMAGLFEGEGCVSTCKRRKLNYFRVTLSSTDLDVIEKLHQISGIGTVSPNTKKEGRKPSWTWTVSKMTDVVRFLTAIAPIMSERRRARIADAAEHIYLQIKPIPCSYCGVLFRSNTIGRYCQDDCRKATKSDQQKERRRKIAEAKFSE